MQYRLTYRAHNVLTIKDVAKSIGWHPCTFRYYVVRDVFPAPAVVFGKKRYYSQTQAEEIKELARAFLAKTKGNSE